MGRKNSPKKARSIATTVVSVVSARSNTCGRRAPILFFANLILFNLEVIDEKRFVFENNFERGGNFRM